MFTKINNYLEGVVTILLSRVGFSKQEADEIEKEMNELAEHLGLNNPFMMIRKRGDNNVSSDERE